MIAEVVGIEDELDDHGLPLGRGLNAVRDLLPGGGSAVDIIGQDRNLREIVGVQEAHHALVELLLDVAPLKVTDRGFAALFPPYLLPVFAFSPTNSAYRLNYFIKAVQMSYKRE